MLIRDSSSDKGKEVQQDVDCKRDHSAAKFYRYDLGDGTHTIQPLHSLKCLDVSGWSLDDWATVHQWDCHYGANQRWKIIPVGDGFYQIRSLHSDKCLGVEWASSDDWKFYQQQPCQENGWYQQFEPVYD